MSRESAYRPTLTPRLRSRLLVLARSQGRPYAEVMRARLILLVADGWTIIQAAPEVGLSRRHALTWLKRFAAHGLAGLRWRKRGPAPAEGQR
jgi:transposase